MPVLNGFGLEVLVGKKPCPEYEKDSKCYIESDLHDKKNSELRVMQQLSRDGGIEQAWPVTPFKIRAWIEGSKTQAQEVYFVKLYVDGFLAQKRTIRAGIDVLSDGFAEVEGDKLVIREYCFSLPRYEKDKSDKLDSMRAQQIGSIRAEFYATHYRPVGQYWRPRAPPKNNPQNNRPQYIQANKRDAIAATGGSFTACTTMQGQVHKEVPLRYSGNNDCQPRRAPWWRNYVPGRLLDEVEIHYRMGHDLVEMGLKVKPEPCKDPMSVTCDVDSCEQTGVPTCANRPDSQMSLQVENDPSPVKENAVKTEASMEVAETKTGADPLKKESDNDTMKEEIDEKKYKANILRSGFLAGNTSGNAINMAAFVQSVSAAAPGNSDVSKSGPKVSLDLSSIDTKPVKLEPAHGIITIDSEVTGDDSDNEDLELIESYILVSDDEEMYIIEDLIDPTILELEESSMVDTASESTNQDKGLGSTGSKSTNQNKGAGPRSVQATPPNKQTAGRNISVLSGKGMNANQSGCETPAALRAKIAALGSPMDFGDKENRSPHDARHLQSTPAPGKPALRRDSLGLGSYGVPD